MHFGCTVNSKGYKVLNKVRILQGDGIHEDTVWDILKAVRDNDYSVQKILYLVVVELYYKVIVILV